LVNNGDDWPRGLSRASTKHCQLNYISITFYVGFGQHWCLCASMIRQASFVIPRFKTESEHRKYLRIN
jgi:hypothetical protein